MTERVDFYVLKSAAAKQRWAFACRLIEKAYLLNLKVLVLNDTLADAQALDELLWTFNERSFVPHKLCVDAPGAAAQALDPATPVHLAVLGIAARSDPSQGEPPAADLLLNLATALPPDLQRYARIAEVIDADEERRRAGRERFKAYRDLKLTLETHQLDETADV
jgi:DNA polymerase-3 subunit chi